MSQNFGKGCHLHLIDGSAFIFRAYHALPPLTRKSDGLPIGAVAGFCNMLFRYVESNTGADAPTHVAVIFDKGSHTFRNDLYDLYKANREAMPEDLRPQMPGGLAPPGGPLRGLDRIAHILAAGQTHMAQQVAVFAIYSSGIAAVRAGLLAAHIHLGGAINRVGWPVGPHHRFDPCQ